jgi:hypothetical protein
MDHLELALLHKALFAVGQGRAGRILATLLDLNYIVPQMLQQLSESHTVINFSLCTDDIQAQAHTASLLLLPDGLGLTVSIDLSQPHQQQFSALC